jgi:putative ABC transport system permease protein
MISLALAGLRHRRAAGLVAVAGLAIGTVISLFTVLPMAISAGAVVPSGPVWVFLAVAVAVFAIVWPVTLVTGKLAMHRSPLEVAAESGA